MIRSPLRSPLNPVLSSVVNRRRGGGAAFDPAKLFASGEPGFWYDPSDLSTMFQDSAGTIPVTAAGQPVGRINDKSGRGNHAVQATAGNRPTYEVDAYGVSHLLFDGSNDELATSAVAALTTSMDFTFSAEVPVEAVLNESQFVAMYGAPASSYFLGNVVQSAAVAANSSGAPTFAVDGVAAAGTLARDLRNLFGTGSPHVLEVRSANMTFGWAALRIGAYFTSNALGGKFYGAILCETDVPSRTSTLAFMNSKSGRNISRPVSGMALGDSVIAAYSGNNSVISYVSTALPKNSLAVPGDNIAGQTVEAVTSLHTPTAQWIVAQVGMNDLDPAEAASVAIARLQTLITNTRAKMKASGKLLVGTLTPCRARLITLYGGVNGPIAYQKWLDINEAISGAGATPITGIDARVTSHTAALSDGSGNLAVAYNTDDIHPNNAGRAIIGAAWETALTALGVL